MSEEQEQSQEQEVEQTEEVIEEVQEVEEKKERPEENYKAELARKNAEIARLRAEKESYSAQPERKRDPADITTWSDNELRMLKNSNDPSVAAYKDQADELLLERKVKAIQAREYENRRKEEAKAKLEAEHPEALDPTSEFSMKVEKVMREYDLSRTPAGRLVAAKIVAAEGKASKAKGQDNEASRVSRVKGQMVDGDRPKPTDKGKDLESKRKSLSEDLLFGKENRQVEAISEIMKDRGMTRESFFKKK